MTNKTMLFCGRWTLGFRRSTCCHQGNIFTQKSFGALLTQGMCFTDLHAVHICLVLNLYGASWGGWSRWSQILFLSCDPIDIFTSQTSCRPARRLAPHWLGAPSMMLHVVFSSVWVSNWTQWQEVTLRCFCCAKRHHNLNISIKQ